jgi:hypothetical protein
MDELNIVILEIVGIFNLLRLFKYPILSGNSCKLRDFRFRSSKVVIFQKECGR